MLVWSPASWFAGGVGFFCVGPLDWLVGLLVGTHLRVATILLSVLVMG